MKLAPRQMAILAAMEVVAEIYHNPRDTVNQNIGVAQMRGVKKELAKIHNRLGNRLTENVPWTQLPVDSE